MKFIRKRIPVLLLIIILLVSESASASAYVSDRGESVFGTDSEIEHPEQQSTIAAVANIRDNNLCQQISNTYKAARRRSKRSSFKGYCGAYVANQLVVLGINKSYLSANGKNTFDIYQKMKRTSGGYLIRAYSAKKFALSDALNDIIKNNPSPRYILVGFQKGTSKSGKKYGHVLFIHGIQNGNVYFSDSSTRTIDNIKYKEGEPIVCSLSSFLSQYAKYKLDGVVLFTKNETDIQKNQCQASSTEKTAVINPEKSFRAG